MKYKLVWVLRKLFEFIVFALIALAIIIVTMLITKGLAQMI